MTPELLKTIILEQCDETLPVDYVQRTAATKLSSLTANKEIIVFTGIRRCGKSVLLQTLRQQQKEHNYYLNFEDERLATFTVDDFQLLHEIFIELYGVEKTFYFDEIQNIEGWELFARRLYNNGNKIYITGSNASLFSEELGTRLTGRFISQKIYPYSFYEFAHLRGLDFNPLASLSTAQIGFLRNIFNEYVQLGGFPEYVKYHQDDYLHSLYESIVYRDIVARHKITHTKSIKELLFYLASNCSKEMTYKALQKLLGLGSPTTVADYCSYFEDSYLSFFVNRYSESVKTQMISPKKVYFIDHVLAKLVGFRFSEDSGRLLENIVFIELKRRDYEIFYFKEEQECDFLYRKHGKLIGAIQVCQTLSYPETKQREIAGLVEALTRCAHHEGYILTEREEETLHIEQEGKKYKIIIMPVWKWLLSQ